MNGVDDGDLAAAREAFAAHRWAEARDRLLAARGAGPLEPDDQAALAEAAWWLGDIDRSLIWSEEAFNAHLAGEADACAAAMLAIDLGFSWFLRGDESLGSGWLSRAHRLLDGKPACVEHGYLRLFELDAATAAGEHDSAIEIARSIQAIANRYGDETLGALAVAGEGIATIKAGRVNEGLAVLDEAMLPVVAGRVRPAFAGNIYCQLMSICHELADLRRAGQWTDATERWCRGFSSAVMFVGICRVHRAQLFRIRGDWAAAEREVAHVCDELANMNVIAVGLALYELAEVRRLRGDLAGAAEAYAEAHRHGHDPQPGLALLWLSEGRHAAALDALLAAESSTADRLARTRLWEALVEVAIAAGDLPTAHRASTELADAAAVFGSPGLIASAALAEGRCRLADGDAAGALVALRTARQSWQDLDAPYRVAEARIALAAAQRALGYEHAAQLELDAARTTLDGLGAAVPDTGTAHTEAVTRPGGLTAREAEVLALVARGLSNRQVAEALFVSEKTVARHLANIYTKLDVGSRTAAAAFAHDHGLVAPSSA